MALVNTYDEAVRRVHEAMQAAPHDGKPYRQARAAIEEVRRLVAEELEAEEGSLPEAEKPEK